MCSRAASECCLSDVVKSTFLPLGLITKGLLFDFSARCLQAVAKQSPHQNLRVAGLGH
jgi:hypothetical protein